MLTESLENLERTDAFSTFTELMGFIRGRNQKYLVLTCSKDVSTLMTRIKQEETTHFDIVLLGKTEPHLYLDPLMALATSDPDIIRQFLSEQGFRCLPLPA